MGGAYQLSYPKTKKSSSFQSLIFKMKEVFLCLLKQEKLSLERRCFMGKIATRAFCNTLKTGAFSSELTRCPTKSEIEAMSGFFVKGTYSENQLVKEEDVIGPVTVIIVGDSGNIIKTQV